MNNFTNNLPPGCQSSAIEQRFGDGDPDVDANDCVENDERPTMAAEPSESREAVIASFNVAFSQKFNVNGDYSKTTLVNMSLHAQEHGRPELAYLLQRHAEIAERIV